MKTLMMTTAALLLAVPALGAGTAAAEEVMMLEATPSVDELRGYLVPDSPRRTRSIEIVAGLVKPQASRPAAIADAAATVAAPQAPAAPEPVPAALPAPAPAEPSAPDEAAPANAEAEEPVAKPTTIGYRIQFGFDSADLMLESRPFLDQLGKLLTEEADLALVVEGHTDSSGSAPYNLGLSLRRAEAVKAYLARTWDVDPGRLVVEGLGESEPLSRNPEAAENRRVQFRPVGA